MWEGAPETIVAAQILSVGVRRSQVYTLDLLFTSCVTLDKLLDLSGPVSSPA